MGRHGRPGMRMRCSIRISFRAGRQSKTDTYHYPNPCSHIHPRSYANTDANAFSITFSNSTTNAHAVSNPIPHSFAVTVSNPNAHAFSHSHFNPPSYTYTHTYGHAHTAYPIPYPNAYVRASAHTHGIPHSVFSSSFGAGSASPTRSYAHPNTPSHAYPSPHTYPYAHSYADTPCPASGNDSRFHRRGQPTLMRSPHRRFPRLLGKRRKGTIIASP